MTLLVVIDDNPVKAGFECDVVSISYLQISVE